MTTYIQRKQSWGSNILALGVITTHKNSVHSTRKITLEYTHLAALTKAIYIYIYRKSGNVHVSIFWPIKF